MKYKDTKRRQVCHALSRTSWLFAIIFLILIPTSVYALPKHIHLTWQGDPKTTITVSWRTNSTEPSRLEYGINCSYGEIATGQPGAIHHVELMNLSPSTVYHYRCGSEGNMSEDLTFITAPSDPNAPITFVAFGDSRTNWNTWRTVAQAVLVSDPMFTLHTGDLITTGEVQSQWDIWFDYGEPLMSRKVLMPCLGNHEENTPKYFEQFALPDPRQWYSFDYGNAHFIALTTEYSMTGEQLEWLEEDLASTDAMWKFVFYHKPMYSSGSHGPTISVQNAWRDIFDKYHIDMVFNGHDHIYERSYPLFAGEVVNSSDEGTIHIVTGGAGAGLHSIDTPNNPWTAKALSINHFVLITIDGPNLHMEARKVGQTVFDALDINKTLYPDLTISNLTVSPEVPSPGGNANLSIRIRNKGHASSGNFSVGLIIEEEICTVLNVSSLDPGCERVLQTVWSVDTEGEYNLTISTDIYEGVDEGVFENNNAAGRTVLVSRPKPDLVPVYIDIEEGKLLLGEKVVLTTRIENRGILDSDAFEAVFSVGNTSTNISCSGLKIGKHCDIRLPEMELGRGDWSMSIVIDMLEEIDELHEDNNDLTVMAPIRDLMNVGPAYYPSGAIEGESLIILYDDIEGILPDDSPSCAIVWGTNGWRRPDLRCSRTANVESHVESVMERGLDGLWWISIPTDKNVRWVDFKFRNGQIVGDVVDDNSGSSWSVPMRGWAVESLQELHDAIQDASLNGVDTSLYQSVLALANQSLLSGNYAGAVEIIGNHTGTVQRKISLVLLEMAEEEYLAAIQDGISIPYWEVMLRAARASIESGNYVSARSYSELVLERIEKARSEIGEVSIQPILGGLISLFLLRISRKYRGKL